MIEQLNQSPLFRGIQPTDITRILEGIKYQVKNYPAKSTIAIQGEACNYLMMILSGAVQGQMLDYSGKLIVIEELSNPMLIAPAFLYADKNELPVNVVCMKESSVLFIHKSDFTDLLQQSKPILQNYLTIISNRSKFLSGKIMFLSFKNLKSKIAAFLLQKYQEQQTTELHIPETQQDLADFFGVARPSLARVLKDMKEEGLIDIQKKTISLLQLTALKKEAM